VLEDAAGQDSSIEFDEIGHRSLSFSLSFSVFSPTPFFNSDDARETMTNYQIGVIKVIKPSSTPNFVGLLVAAVVVIGVALIWNRPQKNNSLKRY